MTTMSSRHVVQRQAGSHVALDSLGTEAEMDDNSLRHQMGRKCGPRSSIESNVALDLDDMQYLVAPERKHQ